MSNETVTAEQQFNVPYATVLADLQKLASTISGGDLSHSHGLDCTTVIAHHWDKQARRIVELEGENARLKKACDEYSEAEVLLTRAAAEPEGDTNWQTLGLTAGWRRS